MNDCRNCEYFKKKNMDGFSLWEKFQSVVGFCMDSNNPYFNDYACRYGRGICRLESYIKPKWCAKR